VSKFPTPPHLFTIALEGGKGRRKKKETKSTGGLFPPPPASANGGEKAGKEKPSLQLLSSCRHGGRGEDRGRGRGGEEEPGVLLVPLRVLGLEEPRRKRRGEKKKGGGDGHARCPLFLSSNNFPGKRMGKSRRKGARGRKRKREKRDPLAFTPLTVSGSRCCE